MYRRTMITEHTTTEQTSSNRVAGRQRRGAAMVLMLFLLILVLIFAALAVDVGMMVTLRTQVQNAVDAGALAANLKLRDDPNAVDEAADAARKFIQHNVVGSNKLIPDGAIQVEIGLWDSDTETFTASTDQPNAVRVYARQDNESFFFGRVMGHTTYGAPAQAIAAGTGNPLDIMLVLDLSGSMRDNGRIEALWNSAPVFINMIEGFGTDDQIGVIGLSADPEEYDPAAAGHAGVLLDSGLHNRRYHHVGVLESPLTTDYSRLRNSILTQSNLEAGKYGGYTGTGAALGDAAHYLNNNADAREDAIKVIVLMSDGYANRPSSSGPSYARNMAVYAANNSVLIYTISLGNSADVVLMEDIARIGAGMHFDARGVGEAQLTQTLSDAFRKIAGEIHRAHLVH